jgi:hypothetical protein
MIAIIIKPRVKSIHEKLYFVTLVSLTATPTAKNCRMIAITKRIFNIMAYLV